ncbi:hypothetical protein B0J17DRAFT_148695 [Rhizoctonia solani]|nr:hypothetical protein B0J17DRAFT_148695 [Rhizoctonia solani]
MSVDRGPVERPKKIIIVLSSYSGSGNESTTIPTDLNEYPQTVHLQRLPWIEKPSRIDRLVDRLGLKKDRKLPIDDAVAGSYKFISRNYRTGDHLILVVDVILPRDEKSLIDAAETLAKHLHNGTIPRHLPKTQSEDGSYALGRCIPLYSVIVDGASVSESISDWNDQIKSRFPPGIKYITCSRGDYSCSTMSNPDGGLDSREVMEITQTRLIEVSSVLSLLDMLLPGRRLATSV